MTEAILRDHEADLSEGSARTSRSSTARWSRRSTSSTTASTMAKVEAGRTLVRLSSVDVQELFRTLRAVVTALPAHAASSCASTRPGDVPVLETDAFKLSQILRNFIVNALKFTEAGTSTCAPRGADGEGGRFDVSDTGPGPVAGGPAPRVRGVRPARRRAPRRAARHRPRPAADAPPRGDPRRRGRRRSTLGAGATFTVQVPRAIRADVDGVDIVEPT
jgi:hypothetical protein